MHTHVTYIMYAYACYIHNVCIRMLYVCIHVCVKTDNVCIRMYPLAYMHAYNTIHACIQYHTCMHTVPYMHAYNTIYMHDTYIRSISFRVSASYVIKFVGYCKYVVSRSYFIKNDKVGVLCVCYTCMHT
jgi:hypothetical protein